jgi:hypothetical protein
MFKALTIAIIGMTLMLGGHAVLAGTSEAMASDNDSATGRQLSRATETKAQTSNDASAAQAAALNGGAVDRRGNDNHTPDPSKIRPDNAWTFLSRKIASVMAGMVSLVLAAAAVLLLCSSVRDSAVDRFYFRRHWGGFGGSSTGWQISTPLAQLVAGLALAAVSGLLALNLLVPDQKSDTSAAETTSKEAKSAKAESHENHQ